MESSLTNLGDCVVRLSKRELRSYKDAPPGQTRPVIQYELTIMEPEAAWENTYIPPKSIIVATDREEDLKKFAEWILINIGEG